MARPTNVFWKCKFMFCNHFVIIPIYLTCKTCSCDPGITLVWAVSRTEEKKIKICLQGLTLSTKLQNSSAHVDDKTAKCTSDKRTWKACQTTVFQVWICKFVTFLSAALSSLLKLPLGSLSKHDVDESENVSSENVTSRFCHHFSIIQTHNAWKMCSNYPGIKLEPALGT